jgi:hypothetical protein
MRAKSASLGAASPVQPDSGTVKASAEISVRE